MDFSYAVEKGNKEWISQLIALGQEDINGIDREGHTPLGAALWDEKKDMVEFLIEKGAAINANDKHGRTPLHIAIQSNQRDMADLLIKKEADINAQDNDGKTPLHWATETGRKDLTVLLLDNGADVDAIDGNGRTPLYIPESRADNCRSYADVVKVLAQARQNQANPRPFANRVGNAEARER